MFISSDRAGVGSVQLGGIAMEPITQ